MSEKKHPASDARLKKLRSEGKSYKSQLLSTALSMFVLFLVVAVIFRFAWVRIVLLLSYPMRYEPEQLLRFIEQLLTNALLVLIGTLGVCAVLSFVWQFFIPKKAFSLKAAMPSFASFSLSTYKKNWQENFLPFMLLLFLSFLIFLAYCLILGKFQLIRLDFSALATLHKNSILIFFALLSLIGLLDFYYRKVLFHREAKMTLEELKQEHKEQEGDANIKKILISEEQRSVYQQIEKKIDSNSILIVGVE